MNPSISILMANFNKADYIAEAIDSVLNQINGNWELIILDDASTDNSVQVIRAKIKNDKRIRFYQNNKNSGTAYCQKKLTDLAKADIVGVLDSDDVLSNDALENVLSIYSKYKNIGFVYSRCMICDENMNAMELGSSQKIPGNDTVLRIDRVSAFRTFRISSYKKTSGYDLDMVYAEDADIIIKLEEVTDFYFVDKVLYYYRQAPNSQFAGNVRKRIINHANHAIAKYRAYLRRLGTKMPNLSRKEMSDEMYRALTNSILLQDWQRAWYFFSKAFILYPLNILGMLKFLPRYFKYRIYGYPK